MKKPRPANKPPRIGRKRRTLGWTLLTLGLLVAGVWAASGWYVVKVPRGTWQVQLRRGVFIIDSTVHLSFDLFAEPPSIEPVGAPRWEWRGATQRNWPGCIDAFVVTYIRSPPSSIAPPDPDAGNYRRWLHIAIWPIPLLLWTTAALLLRSSSLARRRANTGQCVKCGYDLAGLGAGAACPECGKLP